MTTIETGLVATAVCLIGLTVMVAWQQWQIDKLRRAA